MVKKKYKITGMDCAACATLIEMDLEDAGVQAKCSFPKETLEVAFDEKKTKEDKIREVVTRSGYSID